MARALTAAVLGWLLVIPGAGGGGAQMPQRGGTVTVSQGVFSPPPCLNVLLRSATLPAPTRREVLRGRSRSRFDAVLRENLVTRVDFTTKPPFTLTYHIRPEAQWSDGVPITARDFVFTHEAILRHETPDFLDFIASASEACQRSTRRR